MGSVVSRQNAKPGYLIFKNTLLITPRPMSIQVRIAETRRLQRKTKNKDIVFVHAFSLIGQRVKETAGVSVTLN